MRTDHDGDLACQQKSYSFSRLGEVTVSAISTQEDLYILRDAKAFSADSRNFKCY